MHQLFKGFMPKASLFSLGLAAMVVFFAGQQSSRTPASNVQGFELHIQSLKIEVGSKLRHVSNASLRLTFDKNTVLDLGKNEKLNLTSGDARKIDAHVDIKPSWIKDDSIEFKVELIENGLIETVLLRCSTVAKSLSVYNRGYNCAVPGETAPILSYRVARKGAPLPNSSIATAQSSLGQ